MKRFFYIFLFVANCYADDLTICVKNNTDIIPTQDLKICIKNTTVDMLTDSNATATGCSGTPYKRDSVNNVWAVSFPWGYIEGVSMCTNTFDESGKYVGFNPDNPPNGYGTGLGGNCACKRTYPGESKWVQGYFYPKLTAENCDACARGCAEQVACHSSVLSKIIIEK